MCDNCILKIISDGETMYQNKNTSDSRMSITTIKYGSTTGRPNIYDAMSALYKILNVASRHSVLARIDPCIATAEGGNCWIDKMHLVNLSFSLPETCTHNLWLASSS